MQMKRKSLKASFFVTLLIAMLSGVPSAADIQCGDPPLLGGVVAAGTYIGEAPGPFAAMLKALEQTGMELPDCPECPTPLVGCAPSLAHSGDIQWEFVLNGSTGRWTATGTVGESFRWYQLCLPCEEPLGR
jgi:hypothetical protein